MDDEEILRRNCEMNYCKWIHLDEAMQSLSDARQDERQKMITEIEVIKEDVELAGCVHNLEDEGYYKAIMNVLGMLKKGDKNDTK